MAPVVHKGSDISNVEALFGQFDPRITLVTESGLYSLILKTRKPEANSGSKVGGRDSLVYTRYKVSTLLKRQ